MRYLLLPFAFSAVGCGVGLDSDSPTDADYFQQHVAKADAEDGRGEGDDVFCTRHADDFYPTNGSGSRIGSGMALEACRRAIRTAAHGLVCGMHEDLYYVHSIATGVRTGSGMEFETCVRSLSGAPPHPAPRFHCSRVNGSYYVTRSEDHALLGSPHARQTCEELVAAANGGLICTFAHDYFRLTKESGELLGDGLDFDSCIAATKTSREGVVCMRSNTSGITLAKRIEDQVALGAGMESETCLEAVSSARHGRMCTSYRGSFFPTSILTLDRFGEGMDLPTCVQTL